MSTVYMTDFDDMFNAGTATSWTYGKGDLLARFIADSSRVQDGTNRNGVLNLAIGSNVGVLKWVTKELMMKFPQTTTPYANGTGSIIFSAVERKSKKEFVVGECYTLGAKLIKSWSTTTPIVMVYGSNDQVANKFSIATSSSATDMYVETTVKITGVTDTELSGIIEVFINSVKTYSQAWADIGSIIIGPYYAQVWNGSSLVYPTMPPAGGQISYSNIYVDSSAGDPTRHGSVIISSQNFDSVKVGGETEENKDRFYAQHFNIESGLFGMTTDGYVPSGNVEFEATIQDTSDIISATCSLLCDSTDPAIPVSVVSKIDKRGGGSASETSKLALLVDRGLGVNIPIDPVDILNGGITFKNTTERL